MNTSILKLKATVIRPKDDDELDGLAASISFPVECDDEAIGEALGDHDLMAYVVGELHGASDKSCGIHMNRKM